MCTGNSRDRVVLTKMMVLRACVVCMALGLLEVQLIVSPSTPMEVMAGVQSVPETEVVKLTTKFVTTQLSTSENFPTSSLILDYTYDIRISLRLIENLTESLVICMYPGCPLQALQSLLTPEDYASEFLLLLDSLGFANAFLVGDTEGTNRAIISGLRSKSSTTFREVAILSKLSEDKGRDFVGKVLKPSGSNLAVFAVDPESTLYLITALHAYHMLGKGFAYVFAQSAMWHVFDKVPTLIDGLLYVSDRETATTRSRQEFESQLLHAQLTAISQAVSQGSDSPTRIREFLSATYSGKSRNCTVVLVNIQQTTAVIVAPESHALRFPGNSTALPKQSRAIIQVSGNFNGLNFDGSYYPSTDSICRGFRIGYEEVNQRPDILPNFQMDINNVTFGIIFNFDWAVQQITAQRELLGVVHHPPPLSENVIGLTVAFQQLGINLPMSTASGSSRLSDPKVYPLFVRTTSAMLYAATVVVRFFKLFGWKRTAFIYSVNEDDFDFYRCFMKVSQQYNIEITNNETNRMIYPNLDDVQEQLNTTLTEILSSTVRIVIMSHVYNYLIMERMYDLGARAGDYLFLMPYGLSNTFFMGPDVNVRKRRIVGKGSMMFFSDLFVGAVGQSVFSRMYAADGDRLYPLGCTFYDSAMLASHALDFMVARGLHYENATQFVKTMRETRFQGCMGHIQIEEGLNDNIAGALSIINMQVDDSFENVTFRNVAKYSPFSTIMFNISGQIQWPGGTSYFPDSWERDENCPYLLRDIRDFEEGRSLSMSVSFVYSAITALVTAYIWKKWWNIKYPVLTEPESITMEDVFALANIPIDFLQIAAVGPSIGLWMAIMNMLNSMSWTLESFVNITNGVFWAIEIAAFVMVTIYLAICVLKIFDLDSRIARWSFCSTVVYLTDLFLPVLGNALFLPVISTFISTFNCFRSVGPDFTDSFLNRDCSQKCWTETHIPYAVLAAVYLTLYTPTAVLTRPLWQDLQTNLHLKALPLCLMMKSGMEMWLIAASATMKPKEEISHAVVYLITLSMYLGFVLKVKAYNYER